MLAPRFVCITKKGCLSRRVIFDRYTVLSGKCDRLLWTHGTSKLPTRFKRKCPSYPYKFCPKSILLAGISVSAYWTTLRTSLIGETAIGGPPPNPHSYVIKVTKSVSSPCVE